MKALYSLDLIKNQQKMQLVDTHCHIHDAEYNYDIPAILRNAKEAGVTSLICIGTSALDSQRAVRFVEDKPGLYAAVGLHPHDAKLGEDDFEILTTLVSDPKVVAIGEFGLDYYYGNSPKEDQLKALRYQLELAISSGKPCVFHIRESYGEPVGIPGSAFADFFKVFDEYTGVRGVVHSFSSTRSDLAECLKRGLYISLNGIMTFSKEEKQLEAARAVPLDKLLLETDSPFLTPTPKRGTINEPANVRLVAEFLSRLRGESITTLAETTTGNARTLFGIK